MINTVLIIVAVIAVVLLITGGIAPTLSFLLWVGLVLLVVAAILFILRMVSGRKV